jgi:hypothetical protein
MLGRAAAATVAVARGGTTMASPETPQDPRPRDREVIVTNGDRRGAGVGAVIAAIIGVLVVLVVGWMLFAGEGDTPSVDVPSEVDVNVDPGDGGGGGAEGGGGEG